MAAAASDGRVNLSPKGMDSLREIDTNRVIWLNVTGSGNETSAHVQQNPRMTLMFLRLYRNARVIHQNDSNWNELYCCFNPIPAARKVFDLSIDLVQSSCGMTKSYFDYSSA